jgi:hypothetical protein
MVGSLSYPHNPFWSRPVPGIHFCPHIPSFPVEYSYQEQRIVLPILPDQQLHLHCSLPINDSIIWTYERLSKPRAFLRFYVGLSTARSVLFREGIEGIEIATQFAIVIDSGKDSANPHVRIEAQRFAVAKSNQILNFSFYVRPQEFDRMGKIVVKHPIFWYILSCIFVVGLLLALVFIWRHRRATKLTVPYSEIWRLTPELSRTIAVSSFGCSVAISAVIVFVLVKRRQSIGSVLWVSGIAGWLIAALVIQWINGTVGLSGTIGEVRLPGFLYYFLIIFPQRVFALSFPSLRGYPLGHVLPCDGLFLGIVYVFSFVILKRGKFVSPVVEANSGPSPVLLKPLRVGDVVWDVVYVFAAWVLCSSATDDVLDVLFDDRSVPYRLFKLVTLFYAGIAVLRGVLRTRARTTRRTRHWTRDHALIHIPVAVGVVGSLVAQAFQRIGKPKIQVIAAVVSLLPATFAIVLSIGTLCSFAASFITVILAFRPEKIS